MQWHPPRLKRAALVAEFEDGTKMLYAMSSPVTLDVEANERLVDDLWDSGVVRSVTTGPSTLTVSGPFLGGQIWKDRMPGDDHPEIEPQRGEIESA